VAQWFIWGTYRKFRKFRSIIGEKGFSYGEMLAEEINIPLVASKYKDKLKQLLT